MKTASHNIVGLKMLRENMEKYIGEVGKGKSFTIVRRSKPIFKVAPAVDEWGDEGTWETLIDFRKIKKGGVSAGKILKALRTLPK